MVHCQPLFWHQPGTRVCSELLPSTKFWPTHGFNEGFNCVTPDWRTFFGHWWVGRRLCKTDAAPSRSTFRARRCHHHNGTKRQFRYSRNPLYTGLALCYCGLAFAIDNVWLLILLPLTLITVQTSLIKPEEHYLEQKFGDNYREYKKRVRRWL